MKTRNTMVSVVTVNLTCPYCKEAFTDPSGSLMFETSRMPEAGFPLVCGSCHKVSTLPVNVKLEWGS